MSPLVAMPRIDVLQLAQVEGVPEFHPEHDTFVPFPVHGFLIHHPDGAIVVDTGIGLGNGFIDALYPHRSTPLLDELHRCGVDERDVVLIVNSHLHFDHCGQNAVLSCAIAVQQAELEAARQPHYTVDDWATIPVHRARVLDGDAELCEGVRVLLTPGHTPGHQAVVIDSADGAVLIAAQCIFRRAAWHGEVEAANLHGVEWHAEAAASLARLRALRPHRVLLSHDLAVEQARR
ncbi:MAG: MBL fold metallo-hydrolase [Ilumatobacteraceae bacterium]